MSVRFVVPPGCAGGDEVLVDISENEEVLVTVPHGAAAGQCITVDFLEVTTPSGCTEGDEIICCDPEGNSFTCVVPRGCQPGSKFTVQPPSPQHPPPPLPGEEEEEEEEEDALISAATSEALQRLGLSEKACWSVSSSPTSSIDSSSSADTCIATPHDGWQMSPSLLLPAAPPPPKLLCVGLCVEVLRSNGSYTRGTIDAVDEHSLTYTVRMDDGRPKYLVEQEDLRHFRAGAFHVGDRVSVALPSGRELAAIAEFDEDSESYTVLLQRSGKRETFVSDSMIFKA